MLSIEDVWGLSEVSATSKDVVKEHKGSKITVKNVSFTKNSTELNVDLIRPSPTYPNDEIINFQIWDDSGNMLIPVRLNSNSVSEKNKIVHHAKIVLEHYPKETEFLLIKPIIKNIKYDKGVEKSSGTSVITEKIPDDQKITSKLNKEFPIVLNQGDVGKVIITDVQYLTNKTLVHMKVKGEDPYLQVGGIWIEDEVGSEYTQTAKLKLNLEKNEYVKEFPAVDQKHKLNIVTTELETPNVFEDLNVKVPLKW